MKWSLSDIEFRQKLILVLLWVFIALDVWVLFEAWSYIPYETFWRGECAQRVETVSSWCLVWKYDVMENKSFQAKVERLANADRINWSEMWLNESA